jgi:hypothetical protein
MDFKQYTGEVLMLLAGGVIGWLTNHRREKADIRLTEASVRQTEVDVLDRALSAINEKVVEPLTARFGILQSDYELVLKELKQLRNAISKMYVCRYTDNCPVRFELQKQQAVRNGAGKRKPAANRQREPGGEADGEGGSDTAIDGGDDDRGECATRPAPRRPV